VCISHKPCISLYVLAEQGNPIENLLPERQLNRVALFCCTEKEDGGFAPQPPPALGSFFMLGHKMEVGLPPALFVCLWGIASKSLKSKNKAHY